VVGGLHRRAIGCLVDLQREMGGNALIGRELYPLVAGAGYRDVHVSPRMVYADASRPDLARGFTELTFIAMVEGVGTVRGVVEPGEPGAGDTRPLPDRRIGRGLLLHLLQGDREEVAGAMRYPPNAASQKSAG